MQDVVTRCLGLVSQYNPLNTAPGALSRANNCVINRENIVEDRRGYLSELTLSNSINQLLVFSNEVLAHNGSTLSFDNSGTEVPVSGSYSAPSGYKMRGVEAFSNLYVTTDAGIQVVTDTAGTIARKAGAPRPLDLVLSTTGSNGFMSGIVLTTTGNSTNGSASLASLASTTGILVGMNISGTGIPAGTTVASISGSTVTMSANASASNTGVAVTFANSTNCAYRGVIQRTDANKNVLLSYPSQRSWIANSTATALNVSVTQYLPVEAVAGDVLQVYRTLTQNYFSSIGDSAGDEGHLVYQYTINSTDISNGYVAFTDVMTDTLAGLNATIYTAPSQEGISQANDRPPLAKDIALYRNDYLIFANTQTKQRQFLTLLGVGSLSGKTVTIAGTTYNFGASEIISGGGSPQVLVDTTDIDAVNIDKTARSMVKVINQYASNTSVYAYYLSGSSNTPGQIMLEERGVGGSAFTCQGSDTAIGSMFNPTLPVSPATSATTTSSSSVQKNAIFFSKAKQPEAVPSLNYILVGAANKNILRIAPLRESLIIIKEEGIYRLTGDQPANFQVVPLDLTVFCKAIDSVAVLANTVFMLSNQGVVQISDTGVQVVSREIEPNIKPLLSYASLATHATGWSYESERTYFLSTITNSSDTAAKQTFVFNIFTRAWTIWTFGVSAAIVEPGADKLYFAKPSGLIIYKERKDFQDSDYSDPESSITITSIVGNNVTFTIVGSAPDVGWVILQNGIELPIGSITSGAGFYTALMANDVPATWATGAATIYPSVGMEVVWDTWSGGQPAQLKQVSEFAVLTDNTGANNTATALIPTFKSNFDENTDEVPTTLPGGAWGGPWGSIPWGGGGDPYGYRTFVPRNKQFCRTLNPGVKHKNARERLSVAGCAFLFEVLSERIGR